ncbi:MAG: TRC40/GET3/ArsA family transport-energizing ATPase, partial [Nitrospinota bacterium]
MSERIILFAGKGGVGKTTIASATGVSCAKKGKRTIIMSLDAAHSLSDSFDMDKRLMDRESGKPVKVNKNLWIQEIDVQEEIEENWGDIHKYISSLFNATGLDEILAEEMAILPGMEEVSALFYINRYFKEKRFDVILLDCAPTGESLRFISMPTALEWYMKKLFKLERNLARIVRPIANKVTSIPIPEDRYFQSIQNLYKKLRGIEEIMKGYRTTSVRLITNPEKIVIKETQRSFMYFCL